MIEIEFRNQAVKFLEKLSNDANKRIINKIESLSTYPFPHDAKRVVGHKEKVFRMRVGNYISNHINHSVSKCGLSITKPQKFPKNFCG